MYVFRQFTVVKEGFGANRGDQVQFNKRLRIDTRGTTIAETATIPRHTIKFQKASVTVNEYGNAVNYTGKLEDLSEFDVRDEYASGLVEDQKDTLDREVAAQFSSAKIKAVATNTATTVFTSDGTATITATANPSDKTLRDVVDQLGKKQCPKYKGGNYFIGLFSVGAMRGVYDYVTSVAQYADPQFRLTNEVGQYYACRLVQETNLLSNVIGSGTALSEAFVFGDDAVCEAVAIAEELRYQEDEFGRDKALAWYAILGFKKIWDLVDDNLNSNVNGLERIVHITSA